MTRTLLLLAAVFLSCPSPAWSAAKPKIEDGRVVTLAYKLTVGGVLLETADAKTPFIYAHGKNQIVPGLEKNLSGLTVGDRRTIRVKPEEGYGLKNPNALQEVPAEKLPPDVPREKGTIMEARDPNGVPQLVKIVEVREKTVVVDFNHPLAGKELEFQIEILKIK